jgi:mRNA interferase RelE/StbE
VKFTLVYTNRSLKDISRLNLDDKKRVKQALERYSESPISHARRMVEPAIGTYRFRIGDLRVIFDLEDGEIIILRVGHRRDIYKEK